MTGPSIVEVGKPYYPDGEIPPKGMRYDFRGGQHCLDVVLPDVLGGEIEHFRYGRVNFALGIHRGENDPCIIFLLFQIPGFIGWSDCPFTIHLVDPAIRQLPDADSVASVIEPHALLHMTLVDAATGIVKALRLLTFSPSFTAQLHLAIKAQLESPWPGKEAYHQAIDRIYGVRYPDVSWMLTDDKFIVARCTGGD